MAVDWYSGAGAPELALRAGDGTVLTIGLAGGRDLDPSRWYRASLALPATGDDARLAVVDVTTDEIVVERSVDLPGSEITLDAVCVVPAAGAETYLDNLVVEQ